MASRVDNLEKRKKKVIRKSLSKMKKAGEAGKDKKTIRVAKRGDKKIKRINKKIDRSMARQEERGMRRAEKGAYGGRVKTSGMRKKAKAKAIPQKVLSAVKKTPKLFLEDMRDAASTLKKGAQTAAMKVKNRKKKNK